MMDRLMKREAVWMEGKKKMVKEGRIDEWMNGWMDRWIGEQTNQSTGLL